LSSIGVANSYDPEGNHRESTVGFLPDCDIFHYQIPGISCPVNA